MLWGQGYGGFQARSTFFHIYPGFASLSSQICPCDCSPQTGSGSLCHWCFRQYQMTQALLGSLSAYVREDELGGWVQTEHQAEQRPPGPPRGGSDLGSPHLADGDTTFYWAFPNSSLRGQTGTSVVTWASFFYWVTAILVGKRPSNGCLTRRSRATVEIGDRFYCLSSAYLKDFFLFWGQFVSVNSNQFKNSPFICFLIISLISETLRDLDQALTPDRSELQELQKAWLLYTNLLHQKSACPTPSNSVFCSLSCHLKVTWHLW